MKRSSSGSVRSFHHPTSQFPEMMVTIPSSKYSADGARRRRRRQHRQYRDARRAAGRARGARQGPGSRRHEAQLKNAAGCPSQWGNRRLKSHLRDCAWHAYGHDRRRRQRQCGKCSVISVISAPVAFDKLPFRLSPPDLRSPLLRRVNQLVQLSSLTPQSRSIVPKARALDGSSASRPTKPAPTVRSQLAARLVTRCEGSERAANVSASRRDRQRDRLTGPVTSSS